MVKRWSLSLVLALAAVGCGEDPVTQVIVVVDSDLIPPGELDHIAIDVTSPGGGLQTSMAALGPGEPALPRTLTLVHTTGALGPFTVRVDGRLEGASVVRREATFAFQPDQSLVLTMHLTRACQAIACGPGQTCSESGCSSVDSTARLTVWTGTPPRLGEVPMTDLGVPCAAETCNGMDDDCDGNVDEDVTISAETCNGVDDDCDGTTDEGFDFQGDEMNCGGCGIECVFRNGTGTCSGGACVVSACDPGFEDCNNNGADGCEIDTTSNASNCAGCGNVCRNPDRLCCSGTCQRNC